MSGTGQVETYVVQANFLPEGLVEIELSCGKRHVITAKSFYAALGDTMQEQAAVASLVLPEGMYAMSQKASTVDVGIYIPSTVQDLMYTRWDTPKKVRTPNLMISIRLKQDGDQYVVKDVRYLSTKLERSQLPSEIPFAPDHQNIFLSPFSNTYDEGSMCYGNNVLPVKVGKQDWRVLEEYHNFLWASPFNDDLGIKAISSQMSVSEWYTMLHECVEKDSPFPYDLLRV